MCHSFLEGRDCDSPLQLAVAGGNGPHSEATWFLKSSPRRPPALRANPEPPAGAPRGPGGGGAVPVTRMSTLRSSHARPTVPRIWCGGEARSVGVGCWRAGLLACSRGSCGGLGSGHHGSTVPSDNWPRAVQVAPGGGLSCQSSGRTGLVDPWDASPALVSMLLFQ